MGIGSWLKQTPAYGAARSAYRTVNPRKLDASERGQLYDEQLVQVMRMVLKPDSIALDVGANIGDILREMVAIAPWGRHYAFEPIPELAGDLVTHYPRVRVHNCALSDRSGRANFRVVTTNLAQSSLRDTVLHGEGHQFRTIEVELKRLDDVIAADEPIAFIKIGAEGAEASILRGGIATIRRCRPVIVFEASTNTTAAFGETPYSFYELICGELGMQLSTMRRWMEGGPWLDWRSFRLSYERTRDFYFLASY